MRRKISTKRIASDAGRAAGRRRASVRGDGEPEAEPSAPNAEPVTDRASVASAASSEEAHVLVGEEARRFLDEASTSDDPHLGRGKPLRPTSAEDQRRGEGDDDVEDGDDREDLDRAEGSALRLNARPVSSSTPKIGGHRGAERHQDVLVGERREQHACAMCGRIT